jgi:hypothetical protein
LLKNWQNSHFDFRSFKANSNGSHIAEKIAVAALVPALLTWRIALCSPSQTQGRRHLIYRRRVMADIVSMVSDREPTESFFSELRAILPAQFYGARRGTSEIEPLRRLMIAMLVDAVRYFETKFDAHQPARRQEFAEVRSWIFSDADDGVFSFKAVCDALGVDPGVTRKGLTRWEEKRFAGQKRRAIRHLALPAKRISA